MLFNYNYFTIPFLLMFANNVKTRTFSSMANLIYIGKIASNSSIVIVINDR